MAKKTDVQLLINGKIYTLSGYESAEYLNRVGTYINKKISELSENKTFRFHSGDTKHTLIELNIADDYFKAKKQAESLEHDLEQKGKEIYDLKHELIDIQLKLEQANKTLADTKEELQKKQLQNVQLETKLNTKPNSKSTVKTTLKPSATQTGKANNTTTPPISTQNTGIPTSTPDTKTSKSTPNIKSTNSHESSDKA